MASMPSANEPKPRGSAQDDQPKTKETSKHTFPPGHQSPGTQPGVTEYETPEPKHLAEGPTEETKRAPQHEPGYEQRMQKEGKPGERERQDDALHRSQADDSKAEIDADHDLKAQHDQKANRTRTARAKQHVKHAKPKVRKHK